MGGWHFNNAGRKALIVYSIHRPPIFLLRSRPAWGIVNDMTKLSNIIKSVGIVALNILIVFVLIDLGCSQVHGQTVTNYYPGSVTPSSTVTTTNAKGAITTVYTPPVTNPPVAISVTTTAPVSSTASPTASDTATN